MDKLKALLIENSLNNPLLENSLKACGFNFHTSQYSPAFLALAREIKPDIILFNVDSPSKSMLADVLSLNHHPAIPVILFAQDDTIDTIQQVVKANVAAYIVDGFEQRRLKGIIHVAIARFKQQQLLKTELEEACAKLEDRKQIDRAKAILIKTRQFNEDEAYHTLRKLAMDRKITLGEMAKNVIAMAELLK